MKHRIWILFGIGIVIIMVLISLFMEKNLTATPILTPTNPPTIATSTPVATTSPSHTTLPIVSPKPAPSPIGSSPMHSPFDVAISLTIGNHVVLSDGLIVTLTNIDDSRCKTGVQ